MKKIIKVGCLSDGKKYVVPMIRMSGYWLESIGFQPGCRIEVTGEMGQITLQVVRFDRKPQTNTIITGEEYYGI